MNTETPVLLLSFNRNDTVKQVFEAIAREKPKRLYLASDGPRAEVAGEAENVLAVRKYLLDNVSWNCEVKTLFRDKNLGCKYAVSKALSWFFENEEMGIILEDDCYPSHGFFGFCTELLEKYKYDKNIGMISGRNELGVYKPESGYFVTSRGFIWGWATWRRAYSGFNVEIGGHNTRINTLQLLLRSTSMVEFLYRWLCVKMIVNKQVNSWGYPWGLYLLLNKYKSIIPSCNLIKNIGGGNNATHTKMLVDSIALYDIDLPVAKGMVVREEREFVVQTIIGGRGIRRYVQYVMLTLYRLFFKKNLSRAVKLIAM